MLNQTVNFVTIGKDLLKGEGTAFIFEVKNFGGDESEIDGLTANPLIDVVYQTGGYIVFDSVESSLFRNNLMMVDGLLPVILAEALISAFATNCFALPFIVELLDKNNPIDYPQVSNVSYYKYKIKDFLRHLILGMDASQVWVGEPNIYEHYPVLKDGNQIMYYTDDIDSFLEVLLIRAYIEEPKIEIFKNNDKLFMKANLEVGLRPLANP